MNPLLYLVAALLAIVLVLIGIDVWQRHTIVNQAKGEAAAAAVNQVEIGHAKSELDKELDDLRAYRTAHPDVPVQLCSPVVRTVTKTVTIPGAPAAGLPEVHGPDTEIREGRNPPDIAGLLTAFAASAESVAMDLRQQQAVP